ncbi:hypothetical protein CQA49_01865 [Helicobacter sp. MIT 00-7814]|uniref:class I SAM-dependent methyltransferase n=1 Tax=unclassified Helicobacter TaxID=2593540 RepID=UPI000E1E719F|nr:MULTISPECIES: methyltransferase domain-containing protein [unclassified Helicobacter]RDU56152.1 hypothetical protein CQA37_02310 [Helicobacter sp. MIT 99-10781]RDU56249.1 hypothetical protein CQA49_01865 [Helicobacter sp. MIT 00-7814]
MTFQALDAENLKNLQTQFDIIVHFELIEHLLDPNAFMQSIRDNLSENGFCIFTTPNAASLELKALDYNKTRLLAHSLYPPMHLNAFSTQNIALFAFKNKFKLKAIDTPGKFDISILSHSADELEDKILRQICAFDEKTKAYLQYLLVYLDASSHMRVVLQK